MTKGNRFFRLLNVLGNLLLWTEYNTAGQRRLPDVPRWRKWLVNPVLNGLVHFTYPQSVEQRYKPPPKLVRLLKSKMPRG